MNPHSPTTIARQLTNKETCLQESSEINENCVNHVYETIQDNESLFNTIQEYDDIQQAALTVLDIHENQEREDSQPDLPRTVPRIYENQM